MWITPVLIIRHFYYLMALSKDKKKEVVDSVKSIVDDSSCVTFVNFHGLGVEDANKMRSELRENNVGYRVAKKTLAKLALGDADVEGEIPELEGEFALAYSSDILAAAQAVYGQQKKLEEKVSIIGGIFDGAFKNKDEMLYIAQIPSMQILRGQFVNIINSPIQGFASVLNQIAEQKEA